MYGTLQCRVLLVWMPPGLRNWGTERVPWGRTQCQGGPGSTNPGDTVQPISMSQSPWTQTEPWKWVTGESPWGLSLSRRG